MNNMLVFVTIFHLCFGHSKKTKKTENVIHAFSPLNSNIYKLYLNNIFIRKTFDCKNSFNKHLDIQCLLEIASPSFPMSEKNV